MMASQTRPLTTKPIIDKTSQMTNRAMMSPIRRWYAPEQAPSFDFASVLADSHN